MILKYLLHFYNYIVNYLSFSSNKVILKHKNSEDSEDLSYNCLSLNTNISVDTSHSNYDHYYQPIIPYEMTKKNNDKKKLRLKISEYKQEYPLPQCCYCLTNINTNTTLFVYNSMTFCSVVCRRKKMEIDITTSVNSMI